MATLRQNQVVLLHFHIVWKNCNALFSYIKIYQDKVSLQKNYVMAVKLTEIKSAVSIITQHGLSCLLKQEFLFCEQVQYFDNCQAV